MLSTWPASCVVVQQAQQGMGLLPTMLLLLPLYQQRLQQPPRQQLCSRAACSPCCQETAAGSLQWLHLRWPLSSATLHSPPHRGMLISLG